MRAWSLLVFATLVAAATKALAEELTFDKCGEYPFVPDSVDVSPYPAKRGADIVVTVKGTPTVYVSGGKFSYKVSQRLKTWFGTTWLPLPGGSGDLCKYTKCPIRKNKPASVTYKRYLPGFLTSGQYKFTVTVDDNKGNRLMCAVIKVDLKSMFARSFEQQLFLENDAEDMMPKTLDPHAIAA